MASKIKENLILQPYYQHGKITIYHADCFEVLPDLPMNNSVILTDPPYGIGLYYGQYVDSFANMQSIAKRLTRFIQDAKRAAITPGILGVGSYPQPDWIACVYYGERGSFNCCWGFNCWQPILLYGKDPYLEKNKGGRPDVLRMRGQADKNGHPTPKPVLFWKDLLKRISIDRKELIIDPFNGSGTTLICAQILGHSAIGIELEEKYCEIAAKRLEQQNFDFPLDNPEYTGTVPVEVKQR